MIGGGIAGKAQRVLVDDEVDVLGKAIDQPPGLGQRSAALESDALPGSGGHEQHAQRPAHPEILVDAGSLQALGLSGRDAGQAAFAGRQTGKDVHGSGGEPAQNIGHPTRRVGEIFQQLRAVFWRQLPPQDRQRGVSDVILTDMAQHLDDVAAFAAGGGACCAAWFF